MKIKQISQHTLTENVLPDIIVQRTLAQLPPNLKTMYLTKKDEGLTLGIGLDPQLGFYLIQYLNNYQVELLCWENQTHPIAVA